MGSSQIGSLYVVLGVDFQPFIAGLKSAESEAKASAKAWKPLTDTIDDIGKSLKSMGEQLTVGVTLPIVAASALAVEAFDKQAHAVALMENAIRSTGDASGKTSNQLQEMAAALQKNSIFGDENIIGRVETQLLTFTNISGTAFDRATQAALDMSTVLGQDLQSSAIQLGKALNSPIDGVTALQRVGVRLTDSQKESVKAFMDLNDIAGAQGVILQEVEKEFGGAAEAASKAGLGPFRQLSNTIGDLSESFGKLIVDELNPFVQTLSDTVHYLDSTSDATKTTIVELATFAAAIGPVLIGVGALSLGVNQVIGAAVNLSVWLPKVAVIATEAGVTMAAAASLVPWVALAAELIYVNSLMNDIADINKTRADIEEQGVKNTLKTRDALAAVGIVLDQGDKSWADYAQQVNTTAIFFKDELTVAAQDVAKAQMDAAKAAKDHADALKAATEEATRHKAAVDSLVASVIPSTHAASDLTGAIEALNANGIPTATTVAALGQQASKMADQFRLAGDAVPPVIAQLNLAYQQQQTIAMGQKILIDEEKVNLESASQLRTTLANTDIDTARSTIDILRSLDNEYATGKVATAMTTAQFLATLPGAQIDPQIKADSDLLIESAKSAKERAEVAQQYAAAVQATIGDITGRLQSEALTWGNITDTFFDHWHQGALTTGNVMRDLGIKIAGWFLGPLENEFDTFFKNTLNSILDAALGPLRDKLTGFTSSLLHVQGGTASLATSAAGGLASIGSSAYSTALAGAGFTPDGVTGSRSGGSGMSGVLEVAGIGAGISLAVAGIETLVKNMAHYDANELVQNFQQPFDAQFASIINAVTGAMNDGTLTVSDAQTADSDMYSLWKQVSSGVDTWAAGGDSGKQKTAGQFHATEDTFVRGWLDWIDSITIGLGGNKGSLNSFAVGTPYVPYDQIAMIHKGEAIIPAAQNPNNGGGGSNSAAPISVTFTGDFNFNGSPADPSTGRDLVRQLRRVIQMNDSNIVGLLRETAGGARI